MTIRANAFLHCVVEHVESRKLTHGTDLIRLIKNSNVEYDSLLQRLLTQETSFFRYPSLFEALEKKVLPDLHMKKFWRARAPCASGAPDALLEKRPIVSP